MCFNIHVKNPLFLAQKFAKLPTSELIINISDALANALNTKLFIHAFSKNAMLQMTKMLAKELAPKIRVNAICPGYIWNNTNEAMQIARKTLLQNNGSEKDILRAIDYLIESNYITSEILNIDGGGVH